MTNVFLGIDVGTQGLKGVVIDETGSVLATETAEYPTATPKPGWSEQSPEDWRRALDRVLAALVEGRPDFTFRGVGLTGQMHTTVVCDDQGRPLRSAILWSDQRTAPYVDAIQETYGLDTLLGITGNQPLTNFTLLRLLWMRDHQPELYRDIRRVAVAKDWLRFILTGSWGSDVTDASGTYALDVRRRTWAKDWLEQLNIPAAWWGSVAESHEIVGTVHYGPAGLQGVPLVAGAGDQEASAVGTGLGPGDLGLSLGTSGVLFWVLTQYQLPPHPSIHAFCHAETGQWHWMSVTQAAALSLRWFRDQLDPGATYQAINEEAATVEAGSDGLLYWPYLNGERAPILRPEARGGFLGLTLTHRRAHLARAVLEGVAYSLKHSFVIMNETGGVNPRRWVMTGGGAKSALWGDIVASVFNPPGELAPDPGAAVGAAWLARNAVLNQSDRYPLTVHAVATPRLEWLATYEDGFAGYLKGIEQMIPLWERTKA